MKRIVLAVVLGAVLAAPAAADFPAAVEAYDRARAAAQPYEAQRFVEVFGTSDTYTWSEDKARQYTKPERANFGAFVRAKGFKLE